MGVLTAECLCPTCKQFPQNQASDSTRIQVKDVCICHVSPLRLKQMFLMENTSLLPTLHLTSVLPNKCAGSLPIKERKI